MPPRVTKHSYDGPHMIYLIAVLAGLLMAAIGAILGLAFGSVLAGVFGISSFEGAAGHFAASIAILAGFIGLIAGIVLALWIKGGISGFFALGARTAILLVVVTAIATGGVFHPERYGRAFLRRQSRRSNSNSACRPACPRPSAGRSTLKCRPARKGAAGSFKDEWMRREDNRAVLAGLVPLYTRTSSRILVVTLPGQPKLLFQLGLSATPKASTEYGAWQRVSYLDTMKQDSQPRRPNADETFEIRFKVPDWTHR